jgi:hypothetical protein
METQRKKYMFKSSKISSDLQLKKETLEELGYVFDSVSKRSGWNWSAPTNNSDGNLPAEGDVIQDAWRDAGEQAQSILNIPPETWERMATKEQKEMIEDALAGK